MADVLKVDPEKLVETANQFKNYQNELKVAYLTMSNSVRTLDGTWNGDASEQFKSQFESMYKNLEQTEQKMTDAIDELMKANEIYVQTENQIKGQVDALDTGASPFA